MSAIGFQSPLHRGLGSDNYTLEIFALQKYVSIPSSSGPGFGRRRLDRLDATEISFNPLFIGAWVRTPLWAKYPFEVRKVSIPSSSGPGFGPWMRLLAIFPRLNRFNPLFIGAWVRTKGGDTVSASGGGGFNPLFIGAWVRTPGPGAVVFWGGL